MSFTTFLDIANGVMDEIDEDPLEESDFIDPSAEGRRVKRYVNLVYDQVVQSKVIWDWLLLDQTFNTVAGQKVYTPGVELNSLTDLSSLYSGEVTQEPSLELLHFTEFKRLLGGYDELITTQPYVAYVLNGALHLYPTPDSVYSINLVTKKLITPLSAADDEPLIPVRFRDVLYLGALSYAKGHDQEKDTLNARQLFQQRVQQMRNADGNNHKGHAMIPEEETQIAQYCYRILYCCD